MSVVEVAGMSINVRIISFLDQHLSRLVLVAANVTSVPRQ